MHYPSPAKLAVCASTNAQFAEFGVKIVVGVVFYKENKSSTKNMLFFVPSLSFRSCVQSVAKGIMQGIYPKSAYLQLKWSTLVTS